MKALILAAGMGRRMRPLTESTHKTLLPIAGTTILDRLLGSLRSCGVREVWIVTGYRADDIEAAVGERFGDLDVRYVHNDRYETTNNVFSMALALESIDIDDDILLIESDLIVDHRVMEQIVASSHDNVALVDNYRVGMDGTVVSLGADDVVAAVHPSYLQGERFDFTDKYKTLNIYRFSRDFAKARLREMLSFYARTIDSGCYYELLLGVLIYMRAATIHAEKVTFPWAEVDDPNDLAVAEFVFDPPARRASVEASWGGSWNLPYLDFCFIRNTYFPNEAMLAQMRSSMSLVAFNYGSSQEVVNRKLSYFEGCDPANLFVLNGASQAYPVLRHLYGSERALIPDPTFGEYTRIFPGAVTYRDRGLDSNDTVAVGDGLAEEISSVRVVVVVNPNNPTGTTWAATEVLELLVDHPDQIFVVDESFADFSGQSSMVPEVEVRGLTNVIVLKSLSKCWGVPGLRLGYLHTLRAEVHDAMRVATPIWNINSIAEHFVELVLKHRDPLESSFARVVADREDLTAGLSALDVVDHVVPSGANFVLARLAVDARSAASLADRLMEVSSVHVKDASAKVGDGRGYFRLAVRGAADNKVLCEALEQLAGDAT